MYELLIFSIFLNFSRIYKENKREEEVRGKIFYTYENDFFYINVNFPLKQIMTRKADTLLIYYPDEKKGFKIITFPNDLPLGINFLKFAYIKGDTTFKKLGFIFVRKEIKRDTLIIEWATKEKIKRNYIFKKVHDRLTDIIVKGEKNNRLHVKFLDFYVNNKEFFPKEIKIYFKNPFRQYTEDIIFKNPDFNKRIPDSVLNFRFPEGTEVIFKDLRWEK